MQMIVGVNGLGLPLGPANPESLKKLDFHAVRGEPKKMPRDRKSRISRYSRKKSQIDRLKRFKDFRASDPDFQGQVLEVLKKFHPF